MNLASSTLGANTRFRNNLLFGNPRLNWGNGQTVPTAAQLTTWKSLTSDPQFVNPAGNDFHLRSTSPAIGAGEVNTAYAVFQQRYGISIAKDIDGTPRPQLYSIGAYDKTCTASSTPPTAPQAFTGSVAGQTISLQWTAPAASGCSSAPSYILEVGSAPGLSDLATTPVGAVTTLSLPATGVPAGTYYFRVKAQNANGTSPASNEVAITIGGTAPGTPGAFSVTVALGKTSMRWTAPATGGSVSAYVLEAGTATGLKNLGVFTLPASPTVLVGALPPAGTYYFRIRAQNSAGTSGPSNEVRFVAP
jgi:Fibronectin type III domain